MNTNQILNAWKQTEDDVSLKTVAGVPVVDENLLRQIGGGLPGSSGWICTMSGECRLDGAGCNPF